MFTCPFCHLVFSLRAEFQRHLEDEHADRMPKPEPEESPPRERP